MGLIILGIVCIAIMIICVILSCMFINDTTFVLFNVVTGIIFLIIGVNCIICSAEEHAIKSYMNGEYVVDTLNITPKGVITDISIKEYKVK